MFLPFFISSPCLCVCERQRDAVKQHTVNSKDFSGISESSLCVFKMNVFVWVEGGYVTQMNK